ncbi:MAG: diguanylate cyclase [Burkholderiales bacterium]|jgi:diguanylate cyclase (GGDEF)-like protein/PAS domain S-box-containing protein|nr:diguanylate cyclase [Burkholderiales bacterium]
MIPAIRRWLIARAELNTAIALFTLLLLGALWVVVVMEQRDKRDAVVESAVNQNTNLAVAYEEHIVRTLKGLDGALLFMRQEYRRLGPKLNINRYIYEGVIDGSLFSILSVVDERGNVVLSSKPMEAVNYADQEFFRIHQLGRNQDTFYIDKPVPGRTSNTWQVPMSRRIIKPDGAFGGVILLSVDPSHLARFYQKVDIGEHGVVMLIGTDGIIRARRVGNELNFGADISGTSLMREQAEKLSGEILGQGGFDGVRRYVSYRTLPGYPLVVAVGSGQEEVLADFKRNRNRDYMLAALVSVVIMVFAGMLMAALARQKRTVVALQTSEARFRAAFEQAAIGISHTSLDRRYLQVNQKYCDMLGYSLEELMSMSANGITYLDDREDSSNHRHQLLAGIAGSVSAEKRYVRKDGKLIWVNRTVSLVRDHAGNPLYFLHLVEDIMERKRLETELRELAATDMLTGLPNRRAFITRLEEEHARLKRFDAQQAAVLMLDLDYFKKINDTWGHPAGDAVLRRVGEVINAQIREVDLCSRLGGEEFAVLLTGAAPVAAREFAERLRRGIADITVMHEGNNIKVTASIGVAALRATDDDADAALMRADRALYGAKEAGRDRVEIIAAGD